MTSFAFTVVVGEGPVVATAIHDGHEVRPDVAAHLALPDSARLREEDPYTGAWTTIVPSSVVVHRSRFEVDLNRPRDAAIYLEPSQAWGLHVWGSPLPKAAHMRSLTIYDEFYRAMFSFFQSLARRYGKFVVLDLHSYNHRRDGADGPTASPGDNPDINVGTGTMDRQRWRPVVEQFLHDLQCFEWQSPIRKVGENVRFRGGHFPRWIHETFPDHGCALAVEVKKFFMDEWTGRLDAEQHVLVRDALASTLPGILDALSSCPTASSRRPRSSSG